MLNDPPKQITVLFIVNFLLKLKRYQLVKPYQKVRWNWKNLTKSHHKTSKQTCLWVLNLFYWFLNLKPRTTHPLILGSYEVICMHPRNKQSSAASCWEADKRQIAAVIFSPYSQYYITLKWEALQLLMPESR